MCTGDLLGKTIAGTGYSPLFPLFFKEVGQKKVEMYRLYPFSSTLIGG